MKTDSEYEAENDVYKTGRKKKRSRIKCSECNKTFLYHYELKYHIAAHTGGELFSLSDSKGTRCSICDKSFATKSNLRQHTKTKSHIVKQQINCSLHSCSNCDQSFYTQSNLQKHSRSHIAVQPFECFVCKNSFALLDLPDHIKTHTGKSAFICAVCGKCFIQSSNLSSHMKRHAGEQSFHCILCRKSFLNPSNLLVHISSCALWKTSYDCWNRFMRNTKIHSDATLNQCLRENPKFSEFEALADSKNGAVKVQPEPLLKSALEDELDHPSKFPTGNEAQVPALHSSLAPFSIELKVEEDF